MSVRRHLPISLMFLGLWAAIILGLWVTGAPAQQFYIPNAVQVLTPADVASGGTWNGVIDSGAAPPAVDASLQGSGLDQKAIGIIDSYPHITVESPTYVTVGAATADRNQIAKIVFYFEGNTITVTGSALYNKNPTTGSIGATVQLASTAAQNGDATLWYDIYPVDGRVRRLSIPVWLDSSPGGAGYVNRATVAGTAILYADSQVGVDTANCTGAGSSNGTSGNPYASLKQATNCVGNGGTVFLTSGQYFVEDINACLGGVCNQNTITTNPSPRLIDVKPTVPGSCYTIGKTARGQTTGQAVSISIASPAVATATAHGLKAGSAVVFSGTPPTGVSTATIYYVLATGLTSNTFRFSLLAGGAAINSSGSDGGTTYSSGISAANLSVSNQFTTKAQFLRLNTACLDMSTVVIIAGAARATPDLANHSNGALIWANSALADPNGITGGPFGYPQNGAIQVTNSPILGSGGVFNALVESTFTGQVTATWQLARNTTENLSWDSNFFGAEANNIGRFNRHIIQGIAFHERLSLEPQLVVAAVALNTAPCNVGALPQTAVTFSGSATLINSSNPGLGNASADWYTSGGSVFNQSIPLPAASPAVDTTASPASVCLAGDWTTGAGTTIAAGDTLTPYSLAHEDTLQYGQITATAANTENNYEQRTHNHGALTTQPILSQRGNFAGAGTVTTVGTAATFTSATTLQTDDFVQISQVGAANRFQSRRCAIIIDPTHCTLASQFAPDVSSGVTWTQGKNVKGYACVACIFFVNSPNAGSITPASSSNSIFGQFDNANQNWAIIQPTFVGTILSFRTTFGGSGFEDVFIADGIFSDNGSTYVLTNAGVGASLQFDTGTPIVGATIDNVQVFDGIYFGTTNTHPAQNFSVDTTTFKPIAGLSTWFMIGNPLTGLPMFPYTQDGRAIGPISGNVSLGAQQP